MTLTSLKCSGEHAPAPADYLSWHAWAHAMSQTHRQERCATCGKWAVWVQKGSVKR